VVAHGPVFLARYGARSSSAPPRKDTWGFPGRRHRPPTKTVKGIIQIARDKHEKTVVLAPTKNQTERLPPWRTSRALRTKVNKAGPQLARLSAYYLDSNVGKTQLPHVSKTQADPNCYQRLPERARLCSTATP